MGRNASSQPVKLDFGGQCLSGQVLAVTVLAAQQSHAPDSPPLRFGERVMRGVGQPKWKTPWFKARQQPTSESETDMPRLIEVTVDSALALASRKRRY